MPEVVGDAGTDFRLPGAMPNSVGALLHWASGRLAPSHPLIEGDFGTRTIGEATRAVEAAARALRSLGVQAGDRVAATMPNGADILEAFLATQVCGAIWVGVNQSLTADERQHILSDCTPAVVISVDGQPGMTIDHWRSLVIAELTPDRAAGLVAASANRSGHLAGAIAYTSGTTGRPKGVVHSQHNLVVPAAAFAWSGRFEPGQRIGVAYPLTIVNMVIQSLLAALCVGGTCCVLSRRDAAGMLEQIAKHHVEAVSVVPTTAYDIVHGPANEAARPTALKRVLIGGSHVDADLAMGLGTVLGVPVDHGYGLTEAPGLVTCGRVSEPLTAGGDLPHVTVSVRDDDGTSLIEEPGEIIIGPAAAGPWAAVWTPPLGYWAGTGDPPAPLDRAGMVWTNDIGVKDRDGRLTVLDRRSALILSGGSNVYPAEIERVLAGHPDVDGAVVVGRRDARLGQVPVAVVAAKKGKTVDHEALVDRCRTSLAAYKVPEIVIVGEVRRNSLGKADRRWAMEIADRGSGTE